MQGGFNAWEKQGLATQETGTDYQSTVFDSIQDEAETLAESATSFLRSPCWLELRPCCGTSDMPKDTSLLCIFRDAAG